MSSAKLALVLREIAGVVGGIIVPRVLFGRGAAERSERQSRKAARDFRERRSREGKSHPSRGSAAKTI